MAQMASGDLAGAMKRINAALKKQPTHPAWLMCAGACARERQKWEQAEGFFERLALQTPSVFEVWYHLAQVRCEQHKTTPAMNALLQALALQPQHAHCHYLMAGLFKQLGQAQQAQSAYLQALRCQTDHPQASADLGLLWQEQGRFDAAETCYNLAVSLAPRNPVLAYNHALVLQHLQRWDEAEASYRRALALRPGFEEALSNLGALLVSMGRAKEAEQLLQALIQSHPRQPSAHINLGNVWQDQGRLEQAESAFLQALELDPESATARFNLANLLVRTGRPQKAELQFRQAMRQAPEGEPLMAWNLSLLLLSLGRFDEAWPLHEARYADNWPIGHVRTTQPPQLPYPAWQGESLVGRRIVVVQEQGGGDQIQFVRYLPLLLAKGPAHVTLTCPEPLRPLFMQFESERVSVRTVSTLAELPVHDCWV
jgi:tetratricopeptide (TPR) repeat protein